SNGSSKFNEDTTERTVRNTKSCVSEEYYISPVIDNIAFLFGVLLIAENVLMVCVIFRNRALHTNTNILVASLAFTDVMIGIQCLVMGLNARTNLRSWMRHRPTQQRVFHSFIAAANYGLVMISMVHLAVLSVDRYLFVRWPFRYSRRITRRRVLTTAIGIWTIGIIYIIVSVVSYLDPKLHVNCIVVNAPFAYAGGPLLCVYLISLIVVIASRIGMKETLVTNSYDSCSGRVNEIKHIRIPLRTSHSLTKDKDTRDEGNKKLLRRTKFKILKFVLVILGCYLVCTFPSIIRIIMIDLAHIDKLSETVEHASGLMLMANSGMNFLIMTQLNRDFRAALVKSFNCVKC
ncbi:hypothetical protein EGW08_008376, partial [Elysia chlorotica]